MIENKLEKILSLSWFICIATSTILFNSVIDTNGKNNHITESDYSIYYFDEPINVYNKSNFFLVDTYNKSILFIALNNSEPYETQHIEYISVWIINLFNIYLLISIAVYIDYLKIYQDLLENCYRSN